jgi:hypothetical protein
MILANFAPGIKDIHEIEKEEYGTRATQMIQTNTERIPD